MSEAIAAGAESLGYLQHFAYFKKRWLAEEVEVVSTRVVRRGSPLHVRHLVAEADRRRGGLVGGAGAPVGPGARAAHTDADPAARVPGGPTFDESGTRRQTSLPDAAVASRRLLSHACRSGVRIDRKRAEALLPFPLR